MFDLIRTRRIKHNLFLGPNIFSINIGHVRFIVQPSCAIMQPQVVNPYVVGSLRFEVETPHVMQPVTVAQSVTQPVTQDVT
jgi:hypothetical protein